MKVEWGSHPKTVDLTRIKYNLLIKTCAQVRSTYQRTRTKRIDLFTVPKFVSKTTETQLRATYHKGKINLEGSTNAIHFPKE